MPITPYALAHAQELGIHLERLEHLDAMLRKWIEADQLRQALIIQVNRMGHTVFEGLYGSNDKPGQALRMDTLFGVASITKPVIATLIMKLQEDGLLDILEPVAQVLPEFSGGGKEKIALWHLMSHVSGIAYEDMDAFFQHYVAQELGLANPKGATSRAEREALDDQIRQKMGLGADSNVFEAVVMKMPLPREPGVQMSYLGFGYELLKRVIVRVTGESIDQYASRALFEPLGMKDSHFILPEEKWPRMIGWNARCEGAEYTNSVQNYVNDSGNGGLKSSVVDLCRFLEMMRAGGTLEGSRVLSAASVRAMLTNQNEQLGRAYDAWGLGWNLRAEKKDDSGNLRSPLAFDHGGWPGAKVLADPAYGLVTAYCTARYVGVPFGLHGRVINMLVSSMEPVI